MTVHPPYFWAVCRSNSPPHVEEKNGKGTVTEGSYYNIDNLENNNSEHVKQLLIWLDAIYLTKVTKVIKLRDVLLQYYVTRLSTKLVDICNYQITLSSTDSTQNKTARLTVEVETYITEYSSERKKNVQLPKDTTTMTRMRTGKTIYIHFYDK